MAQALSVAPIQWVADSCNFLPEDESRGAANPPGLMDREHPGGSGKDGGEYQWLQLRYYIQVLDDNWLDLNVISDVTLKSSWQNLR